MERQREKAKEDESKYEGEMIDKKESHNVFLLSHRYVFKPFNR